MVQLKRVIAGLSVLAAAFLALAACKNSIDLVAEVKKEVMKANDRYLVVKSVDIPLADGVFSPTGVIAVKLDRAVDPASANAQNISIRVDGGTAVAASSLVIATFDSGKEIRVSVTPYLDTETNYILTISNLVGADGSGILETITRPFITGLIAAGAITKLAGASAESQAGYSVSDSVKIGLKINDAYPLVKYRVYVDGEANAWVESSWQDSSATGGVFEATLSSLAEGERAIRVQFLGKEAGSAASFTGNEATGTITVDLTPPDAPVLSLSVASRTNDTTPAWSWASGAGGAGVFQYQLDSDLGPWTTTSALAFEATALGQGEHFLSLRERDVAGWWSASVSASVVIDTAAPAAPLVTGIPATGDPTPTWNWSSGGGEGAGAYRYQLDLQDAEGWNAAAAASFTPASALGSGNHTLYVQERDLAGNWSASGYFATLVDTTPPAAPIVSGTAETNDTTPTWSWETGGGDGTGQYRHQLNGEAAASWIVTGDTSWTPDTPRTDGQTHTLYVQERDIYGNWSASGTFATLVDSTKTAPIVTLNGDALTKNTTPSWSWGSVDGGSGTFRYHINNAAWVEGVTATTYSYTASVDGTYTLYVQAYISSAAAWSMSGSATVTIDSTPPLPPSVSCITTPTNDETPTWAWSSGGRGGSGWYQYSFDGGGTWSAEIRDISYTPGVSLDAGDYTLSVRERDSIGNWSDPGTRLIVVDLTAPNAPVINAATATATPTNDQTPTWAWATGGNGGNGTYRYSLDTAPSDSSPTTTDLSYTPATALQAWHYTLNVEERDEAGNWSAPASFLITIDTTPPNAPSVNGAAATNDTTPSWSWTTGGNGGSGTYRWQLDGTGGSWSPPQAALEVTWQTVLAAGAHILYVQERDAAGNWSAAGNCTTTIDLTPPDPPIVTGVTPSTTAKPTWTWSSGGGGGNGTYRHQLDGTGGAWSTPAATTSFTPDSNLSEGWHTLYVQERDEAGNWPDTAAGSFPIFVDTVAPTAPAVTSALILTADTTPTWTWTAGGGGNGTYRYSLDTAPNDSSPTTTTSSYTPDTALADGSRTLYVQERDPAGNWSNSGAYTVTVHATGPTVFIASPAAGATCRGPNLVSVTASASDTHGIAEISLYCDGILIGTGNASPFTASWEAMLATEGSHSLTAQAFDSLGNSTTSAAVTVNVDNYTSGTATWISGSGSTDYGKDVSLAVDPANPTYLYACFADTANGSVKLSKSIDAGGTWSLLTGFTENSASLPSIAVGQADSVYVAFYSSGSLYVKRSTNCGNSWNTKSISIPGTPTRTAIAASAQYVYAACAGDSFLRIAISADYGQNFTLYTVGGAGLKGNPSLAIEGTYAHLAYYDGVKKTLSYARAMLGSNFNTPVLLAELPSGFASRPSIAPSLSTGDISISFLDDDGVSVRIKSNANDGTGAWTLAPVVATAAAGSGVSLGWNGTAPYRKSLAYYDAASNALRFACSYGAGTAWVDNWASDIVNPVSEIGLHFASATVQISASVCNLYFAYYDNKRLMFNKMVFRF